MITAGDVSGALLVTDDKYNVDIFLGIGGGPEGVLAASAIDAFNCGFQGRFLFDTDENKKRAKSMGIDNLQKKYELNEIVSGDSIFCATGITSGDLVSGIKIQDQEFISETLVTHKSTGLKSNKIKTKYLMISLINHPFYNKKQQFGPCLSVRTRGFHPRKRGSIPLGTANFIQILKYFFTLIDSDISNSSIN